RDDRGVLQLLVLDMVAQPRRISGWRRPLHITKICHCGHHKNHIKVLDRLGKARPTHDFARGGGGCPLELKFWAPPGLCEPTSCLRAAPAAKRPARGGRLKYCFGC